MATITFEFDTGRTDLQASRQRASDDAYWNFTAEAYEVYDAGNVADYGITLTESPSGTYTATVPDLSAAVAHVDRLYAQAGDLTAADLDLWLTEESSEAVPIPSPGTLGTPDPERVAVIRGGHWIAPVLGHPNGNTVYGVSLEADLAPDAEIASATIDAVTGLTLGTPEANTATFEDPDGSTVPVTRGVLFRLSGGTAPKDYVITGTATDSSGNDYGFSVLLHMRDGQ